MKKIPSGTYLGYTVDCTAGQPDATGASRSVYAGMVTLMAAIMMSSWDLPNNIIPNYY